MDVLELSLANVRLMMVPANLCYLLGLKLMDCTISAMLSICLKLQQSYMLKLLPRLFRTQPKSPKHIL